MKNIVAKCTRSVTYMPKLYRPTRTSSQVTHRPLGSIISLSTVLHEPLYLLLAQHANECRITARNKQCWTADTYIVEPAITLSPSDLLATGPAAQWHVADRVATVIIAAGVQQHTCFNVASVECNSSDVDNGQWYVADDRFYSHQCQDSTAAAVLLTCDGVFVLRPAVQFAGHGCPDIHIPSLRSHHTSNVSLHYLLDCQCFKSNSWKKRRSL